MYIVKSLVVKHTYQLNVNVIDATIQLRAFS